MFEFTVQVDGDEAAIQTIENLGRRGVDARPAFYTIAENLRKAELARFDSAGNGTWRPLAPKTLAEKARKGQDPRILVATGALRASLTRRLSRGSKSRVAPQTLLFGTTLPQARYQLGDKHSPRRAPLTFGVPQKRQALATLQRYVQKGDS